MDLHLNYLGPKTDLGDPGYRFTTLGDTMPRCTWALGVLFFISIGYFWDPVKRNGCR